MQMELHLGAAVVTTAGDEVGTLRRVLLDDAGELDAIVVRLDAGESLDELLESVPEVRLPVGLVRSSASDRLIVDVGSSDLHRFPTYVHERAPTPEDHWIAPPGFGVSDLLGRFALLLGGGASIPARVTELDKGPGEHQIAFHAPAIAAGRHLGQITSVLCDAESGRVLALLLRPRGATDRLVLPAEFVGSVHDDAVEVRITAEQLAGLKRRAP